MKRCSVCKREKQWDEMYGKCDCGFKTCEDCFDTEEPLYELYNGSLRCILCRVYQKSCIKELCYQIRHRFFYLPEKPIRYINCV